MPACIFDSTKTKVLKDIFNINDKVEYHTGTSDPSSVALSAPKGSLYFNTSTGVVYKKMDAGSTTNWIQNVSASETQTLTNKTLTSPTINSPTIVTPTTDVITGNHQSTPSTPAAGKSKLYAKSDGNFYQIDPAGTETKLALGTGSVNTANIADGAVNYLKVAAGMVVQEVNTVVSSYDTTGTQIPTDDTIPQNTEGKEFMSLAITPKKTTNKLKITVTIFGAVNSTTQVTAALFQDTTANALAAAGTCTNGASFNCITFTYYMTAGTTSSTTFKVRAGPNGGVTYYFNGSGGARIFGGVAASSITITEIAV